MIEPILVGFRGTGIIFSISKLKATGAMLYGFFAKREAQELYYGMMHFICNIYILSSILAS